MAQDRERVESVLKKFGDFVVKRSKINIGQSRMVNGKRRRIDNTGKLRESIAYALGVSPNSFSMEFIMEDYGEWVDQGRKKGKGAPPEEIKKWIKTKPIKPRDETGRFVQATESRINSLAFLINRKIKEKGIEPTYFFTKPFDQAFKELPEDLLEAYQLDMESFLRFTTDKFKNIKEV